MLRRGIGLLVLVAVASGLGAWLFGSLLLPSPPPTATSTSAVNASAAAPTLDEVTPNTDLGDRGLAVVVVAGDLNGRFEVGDQWESRLDDEGVYTIAFGGQDRVVITGRPGDRQPDILITFEDQTFFGVNGECSVAFVDFEDTEPFWDAQIGWFGGLRGAGTASCRQVESPGSGAVIDADLAFKFDQLWCGNVAQQCP